VPNCPKCGFNADETMDFCPKCGTVLKTSIPAQVEPQSQKDEKPENQPSPENLVEQADQEKNRYGIVNYLVGGLILITVGVFAILDLTSRFLTSGQDIALMLIIIGIIIITGAIYVHTPVEKYFQNRGSHPKNSS